jgi:hypothetical protein
MDITRMPIGDLTDTEGAALLMASRFKHSVSVDSIHRFVRDGLLPSWIFRRGELVRRDPSQSTKGKDLLFLKADLYTMTPPQRGNPNIANLRRKEKTGTKTP